MIMKKMLFTAFMLMAVNCAVASPWSLDSCISYAVEHSLQVRQRIVDCLLYTSDAADDRR